MLQQGLDIARTLAECFNVGPLEQCGYQQKALVMPYTASLSGIVSWSKTTASRAKKYFAARSITLHHTAQEICHATHCNAVEGVQA
jgi:hypothetical protein